MTTPNNQYDNAGCASSGCAAANASCRLPVLTLFGGAAFWLAVSSVFALIASLKFHKPDLLADCPWFTYGHVHAAHLNALAYGFAAQAGFGVALWLLAQIGKTRLAIPGGASIAAKLWNLGVLVGVGGILGGKGLGYDFFEFPQASAAMLFFAALLLGLSGILTHAKRTECSSSVAPWFLVAALFWFPWLYMTASALLGCVPVRGVAQAAIAWWFANNFLYVWLGLIGLGALFHFVSEFSSRPLHNRRQALYVFWLLVVCCSACGIPASAPLPAWMPTLSAIGAMFSLVLLVALMVNVKKTSGKCLCSRSEPVPKFIGISLWAFVLFVIGKAVTSYPPVSEITDFTWVGPALTQLLLYGFIGMVMFGAIYHIAPQLVGKGFVCVKPLKIHFWLAAVGTILLAGSLAVAGIKQGRLLNDATTDFAAVTKAMLMPFRMSTLGDLLILGGALTLWFNLGGLVCPWSKSGSVSHSGRETKTAEVNK